MDSAPQDGCGRADVIVTDHSARPGGSAADGVSRGTVVRLTCVGLVVGVGYAACLRVWMRLVSTDPEFSWAGTGYILGAFAVLGAMAGLVTAGRRLGWRRRLNGARAAGTVLSLGCFLAAGALMLPTVVPAALGWARSDWPRPARAGLLLFGVVAAVFVVLTLPGLSLSRRLLALAIYALLCPVEVALTARLYAPNPPPGPP